MILKHVRLCVMLKISFNIGNRKRTVFGKEVERKKKSDLRFLRVLILAEICQEPFKSSAFANSNRLRHTAMPFPLGKIRECPHPRAYNGCTYCSRLCVLMVGGVPFGSRGAVGSGQIDQNWLFGGVLAPFLFDYWLPICALLWRRDEYKAICQKRENLLEGQLGRFLEEMNDVESHKRLS
jgi:hypothetical protein